MNGVYLVIQEGNDGCAVYKACSKLSDAYNAAAELKEGLGESSGKFKVIWIEIEN